MAPRRDLRGWLPRAVLWLPQLGAVLYAHRVIRVVCFDLGGVLVRIHRTWDEVTVAAGLSRDVAPFWREPEAVRAWQVAHLAHHRGALDGERYFANVAELSGGYFSAHEMERVHAAWLIGEYPGVAQLVEQLGRAGYLTACLSNTNDYHWRQMSHLAHYPAIGALGVRLASHELGLLKPEPEIYRAAAERFGCRPDEVVFFDDLEENVHGARLAGWNAVRIDPAGSPAEQMRHELAQFGVSLGETSVGK